MKYDVPYNIRLGKLKAELEEIAFEKDIKLTELIRAIFRNYIKKQKEKKAVVKEAEEVKQWSEEEVAEMTARANNAFRKQGRKSTGC